MAFRADYDCTADVHPAVFGRSGGSCRVFFDAQNGSRISGSDGNFLLEYLLDFGTEQGAPQDLWGAAGDTGVLMAAGEGAAQNGEPG